ncbi:MAG: sialate O-acetylesterase, partial [Tidjanibacter sp.]|nr:sialate O-acetylesterase [Tidjanibacter sp.]
MKRFLFAVLTLLGSLLCATAEVRLPDIMSSNMVLQQQSDATLWGYAEAGSKITIRPSWSKQVYTTQTSSEGEWMVKVATPKASNTPYTISVQEDKTTPTVIENVLIGEVWFCSGQSNMFMPLKGYTSQPVEGGVEMILNSGENKTVRVALISKRAALTPQEKVDGRWMECNPLNAQLFSATAYTFALQLNRVLDIP